MRSAPSPVSSRTAACRRPWTPWQGNMSRRGSTTSWARWKPATAANRYRALQRFFGYAAEEGEIRANPMANMKPPKIPENPPDVLDDGQLRDLLKACEGRGFDDRRDAAILMTFIDTGARLAEVAGLRVPDLDLDQLTLLLTQTKGRAPRHVGIGNRTARALDRYLRRRRGHTQAFRDELWLGSKGPLTASGIRQIARRRAAQAGLEHLHPHRSGIRSPTNGWPRAAPRAT
jgi:integrase